MKTLVLLGPQGPQPDIAQVLAAHGVKGKVALVRAGYQEREPDDAEMIASLGVPAFNLELHRRGVEVFREDKELTAAYKTRQQRLRHMQQFYRIRLEKIEDAARTVAVRFVDNELLAQEEKVSVDQFRHLDADHIERCNQLHADFALKWRPTERAAIAKHRQELRALIDDCVALVIAGGHVASLLNRLVLFDVLGLADKLPVFAWSAGAMVLTDRIVLFHDYPPYGSDIAQVLDAGLGKAPGIVVLPDPKRRVNLAQRQGIQRFARRMAPATCVAMDRGHRIEYASGTLVDATAMRLETTGNVEINWQGAPSRFSSPSLRWLTKDVPQ